MKFPALLDIVVRHCANEVGKNIFQSLRDPIIRTVVKELIAPNNFVLRLETQK